MNDPQKSDTKLLGCNSETGGVFLLCINQIE